MPDTSYIVTILIQERDRLNTAIAALQGPKRRGRPPKSAIAAAAPAGRRRARTAKERKAQSARMKAYWAARKKAEKK
jgi:hypothetical protein